VSEHLDVLTAGPASPRKAADFLGPCVASILREAYNEYDLIVLDAPPLLGFPECLQMAASADGVVIVAKAGGTSRKGVATVIDTLQRIGANIVGVVLNQVHQKLSSSYYYYGYYGKYHGHYHGRKGERAS
jgi:Mrp family chromosome partitioning ATPase